MKRSLGSMLSCTFGSLDIDQALAAREVVYAREQRQKSGMNVAYSW